MVLCPNCHRLVTLGLIESEASMSGVPEISMCLNAGGAETYGR
jgi:hypothetical protein